jgi:hypothetical protein
LTNVLHCFLDYEIHHGNPDSIINAIGEGVYIGERPKVVDKGKALQNGEPLVFMGRVGRAVMRWP